MAAQSFVVACPCCQAKLTIDPELGAVIAHEAPPPKRSVDDLGAAFDVMRIEVRRARRALPRADAGRGAEGQAARPEVPGRAQEGQGLARTRPSGRSTTTDELLGDLLRQVSRSFYLSLAILPRPLREPIGLAYLLARAADTVADTRLIAARADRPSRDAPPAYAGQPADAGAVARACAPQQTHEAERRCSSAWTPRWPRWQRCRRRPARVRAVLTTITEGMIFDLERFPGEDAAAWRPWRPSGTSTATPTWWRAASASSGPTCTWRIARGWPAGTPAAMRARGVRFGKALQMTNVLRDVPTDLAHGRCYLPARELAALGLAPADLLDAGRRGPRPTAARPAARAGARPLRRGLALHAGHPAARVADAAGLRVAAAHRPGHAGSARRHPNPFASTRP